MALAGAVLDVAQALQELGRRDRIRGDVAELAAVTAGLEQRRRHQLAGAGWTSATMQGSTHAAGRYTVDSRRRGYHGWMPYKLRDIDLHIGRLNKLVVSLGDDDKTLLYEIVVSKNAEESPTQLKIQVTEEQVDLLLKISAHSRG